MFLVLSKPTYCKIQQISYEIEKCLLSTKTYLLWQRKLQLHQKQQMHCQ